MKNLVHKVRNHDLQLLKVRIRRLFTLTHKMLQNAWTEASKFLVQPVIPTLKSTGVGLIHKRILEFSFVITQIELSIMNRFRDINVSILIPIIRIFCTYILTNVKDWPISSFN
jgi:hypothetical protein